MRHFSVSSALMLLALSPAIANRQRSHIPRHLALARRRGRRSKPRACRHRTSQIRRTKLFVIRATLGGAAEIELARLAEQRTRNNGVREFARHMFRDHSRVDNSLSRLAERDGISVPEEIDAKHQHVRDGLSRLTGLEFDIEYPRLQAQNRQRMAQLMEYVIGSGEDAQVQAFAAATLPTVFMHLAMAPRSPGGGFAAKPAGGRRAAPRSQRDAYPANATAAFELRRSGPAQTRSRRTTTMGRMTTTALKPIWHRRRPVTGHLRSDGASLITVNALARDGSRWQEAVVSLSLIRIPSFQRC
jgi:predicted outer membrane protein